MGLKVFLLMGDAVGGFARVSAFTHVLLDPGTQDTSGLILG